MTDAFTTPEAEMHDEIVVDLHSLNKRLDRISSDLRKSDRVELVTLVLMCCALMFGGCLALEHTLSIQAKDRQENVAWAR